MDEQRFREFLRKGGRSPSAVKRCLAYVAEFETYLGAERAGVGLVEAGAEDLEAFLARIPGVKGIRARLYHDAGVDTLEKIAGWEPEAFRAMIVEFVERTGFDGVPTLLGEARFTIERARELPKIVEY